LDAQGSESTFAFSNWKNNIGVPFDRFVFKIPKDVDVVTDDSSR